MHIGLYDNLCYISASSAEQYVVNEHDKVPKLTFRPDVFTLTGTMKRTRTLRDAHSQRVRDLDYNPNKPYYLVTCGDDCAVKFWDVRKASEQVVCSDGHPSRK